MTDDVRYTLGEARREFARRECANHGHSWNTISTFDGFPIRIICDSCGWSGSVEMNQQPTRIHPSGDKHQS